MRRQTCAILVVWLAAAALLWARAPLDIQVTPVVADGQVSASFAAASTFDDDAQEVAQSGLLLTFTFTLELRRPSTIWLDRVLGSATVSASTKFDNLTGVYQVSKTQDGHVVAADRMRSAADVRVWMTKFDRVILASNEPLEPNAEYYVRVRLQTSPKRTFSFWPFVSDTASGRADFTFIR